MKTKNRTLVSIGLSILILVGGGIGAFYLNDQLTQSVTISASRLGQVPQVDKVKNTSLDLKQIINENQKKVVSLEVEYPEGGKGIGSGFLYNDKGDIITNAHVVSGATNIVVKASDTSLYSGKLIGMSVEKDIAVVRVHGLSGKEPMKLAKDRKVDIGDQVIAFGSPHGLDNTVTTGIISGLDRDFTIENSKYSGVYQISAPIASGNSGGPLVLEKTGEVVGINSAGTNESSGNIGFSIPITQVLTMIEGWSAHPDSQLASQSSSNSNGQLSSHYTEQTFSDEAIYLVQYFYDCINAKDYVTAYSLLGSNWQSNTKYEEFRNGYINTVGVYVHNISAQNATNSSAEISALIEAEETMNGQRQISSYKLQYHVGIENRN